jgi:hypothetical protein
MEMNTLYKFDGQIDCGSPGWEFVPSRETNGMAFNPAEGFYPDKGGKLMGPIITGIEEFRYYMLSFDAQCPDECFWGVLFYDSFGEAIVADVWSLIDKTQKSYRVAVYSRCGAVALQPLFQGPVDLKVSSLTIQRVSPEDVAGLCDQLYETLPEVSGDILGSMRRLPQITSSLRLGGVYRAVMLGDSVVNDTFNSNFHALVQRAYPESECNWICSVRGNTGCWFYREPANFKGYVESFRPDLLIVGGISQKNDLRSIRHVVSRSQEQVGCEILLMTGPFGRLESRDALSGFSLRMEELAENLNVGFLDCCNIWRRYLETYSIPAGYFYRDAVHANDRGKQIIGRVLEQYFSV